jgi:hypothetical protein
MILLVPVEPEAGTARLILALSSAVSVEAEGIVLSLLLSLYVVAVVEAMDSISLLT